MISTDDIIVNSIIAVIISVVFWYLTKRTDDKAKEILDRVNAIIVRQHLKDQTKKYRLCTRVLRYLEDFKRRFVEIKGCIDIVEKGDVSDQTIEQNKKRIVELSTDSVDHLSKFYLEELISLSNTLEEYSDDLSLSETIRNAAGSLKFPFQEALDNYDWKKARLSIISRQLQHSITHLEMDINTIKQETPDYDELVKMAHPDLARFMRDDPR